MAANTKTVGLLCADPSDLYLSKALYLIDKKLSENGIQSMLCATGYTFARKQESLKLILSKKVDAVVLVGSHFVSHDDKENEYIRNAAKQLPVILLNGELDHPGVFFCSSDSYSATKEATLSLIDEGVQDLLYYYDTQSYSGKKKQAGFIDACSDRGVTNTFQLLSVGERDDIDDVASRLERLSESGIRFTGIVASEDYLAVGALKFAKRNGIHVPKELQVIGYNNSLLSKCCEPELTSVDNHLDELCDHIANAAINVLTRGAFPERMILRGELVKRGSTRFQ